jgi:hypothetical protein
MSSLAIHRVVIGVLAVLVLILGSRAIVGKGHDGNPSGLDVLRQPGSDQQGPTVTVSLTNPGNMTCLTENGSCDGVTAELHFLQTSPYPKCPSTVSNQLYCQPVAQNSVRTLPPCESDQTCLEVNTSPKITPPFPFQEFSQDEEDGYLHPSTSANVQFIVVMTPRQPTKVMKKPEH